MEHLSLNQAASYRSPAAEKVCRWLADKDLANWADKHYPIDGDDFYVNIFHYPTAAAEARIWEAHRDYIDVHLVLGGREWVRQAFLADCQAGEYHADRDYQAIDRAQARSSILLEPGYLAVFYPEDAHQTGVIVDGHSENLHEAVFKIRLEALR